MFHMCVEHDAASCRQVSYMKQVFSLTFVAIVPQILCKHLYDRQRWMCREVNGDYITSSLWLLLLLRCLPTGLANVELVLE